MKHVLIFQIDLINIMQGELTTSLACMTCLYSNENRGMETDATTEEKKNAGICNIIKKHETAREIT